MSNITLAHGGGGSLQNELIRKEILSRFSNPLLDSLQKKLFLCLEESNYF